ncbi:hypothetical protein [Micromonospora sp. ATA51]|uniref:hypothetical protein n=1 Tax=Micromonospora sp. ATA51 TaxID=2806098 RepID=UPI001A3D1007|nr:hypothetical protein [Micromonospora sp. ATA51]MBM0225978.1 hypothetical protein [Micromonospora sp. ATA51]
MSLTRSGPAGTGAAGFGAAGFGAVSAPGRFGVAELRLALAAPRPAAGLTSEFRLVDGLRTHTRRSPTRAPACRPWCWCTASPSRTATSPRWR